ncbi:MAG: glycosyltransferase [Planctomycetota bacterium]|nr:glycosyltransferase [Planctomycetota bacterium]
MRPLVSVIMPAFKSERWIREAVDSARAQTPPAQAGIPAQDDWLEIIVCDDGSPQAVGLLLADLLGYPSLILLRTERNRGISAARNTAARCAMGRWLAFLDPDDLWLALKTASQLAEVWRAEAQGGGPVAVVYSNASAIDADGKVLIPAMEWPGPVRDVADLVVENRVPCCTAMVLRAAFDGVGGFDEANVLGTMDYQLWLSLAVAGGRFLYVPEVLASYRVHAGQETSRPDRMLAGTAYALRRAWLGSLGALGRRPPEVALGSPV